jgi:hypothetical protein
LNSEEKVKNEMPSSSMVWSSAKTADRETTDKLNCPPKYRRVNLQPAQATKNRDQDAANEREKSRHRRRTPEHRNALLDSMRATNHETLEKQENRQAQSDDAQETEQEQANA